MAYKSGDYKVVCDLCGKITLRSKCKKTWQGWLVCADRCWRPKHPQESVKVIPEDPTVPDARPDVQTFHKTTAIKTAGTKGDKSIEVDSITGISQYDQIGIVMDGYILAAGDIIHWTFVTETPAGTTVYIKDKLPDAAAADNVVYIVGDRFLSTTEVSTSDL